jgi:hypothetical protein
MIAEKISARKEKARGRFVEQGEQGNTDDRFLLHA